MMKSAILLIALFGSINAKAYPFLGNHYPYNLDTPDDQDEVAAAGPNAAPQGAPATTVAPASSPEDGSSSSESSSSEEDAAAAPPASGPPPSAPPPPPGTTAPSPGPNPNRGAGAGAGQAGANNGQSSGNVETGFAVAPVGGPIGAAPGDTSSAKLTQNVGPANPLQMKPLAIKKQEAQKSGALVAVTTVALVAGVATISIVTYKYKDAIRARMGL